MLFKKETCKVKGQIMNGEYLVIYDMVSKKLHFQGKEKSSSFDIDSIDRLKELENKI